LTREAHTDGCSAVLSAVARFADPIEYGFGWKRVTSLPFRPDVINFVEELFGADGGLSVSDHAVPIPCSASLSRAGELLLVYKPRDKSGGRSVAERFPAAGVVVVRREFADGASHVAYGRGQAQAIEELCRVWAWLNEPVGS
jgi:hypothetical protein